MGNAGIPGTIEEALDAIAAALDALDNPVLSPLSSEEVGDVVLRLYSLSSRFDAVRANLVERAGAVLTGPGTGYRTVAQFVGDHANTDLGVVRRDVRLCSWLDEFPVFAQAHTEGVLTTAHLRQLYRADTAGTRVQLLEDQELLVKFARELSFAEFKPALGYWLIAADPDGREPQHQFLRNRFSYHRNADGTMHGTFEFDSISAEAIQTAVNVEVERLRARNQQNGEHHPVARLRAEAVTNLITTGAANPDSGIPAPVISLVMSQTVAESIMTSLTTGTAPPRWPVDPVDVDGRCETLGGIPIHPAQAASVFPLARFRRFVFDPAGRVTTMASASRVFPKWMRHILLLQSRGRCTAPGCDAPHDWIQADHIHPASRGGPTSLANGQPLCGPHNRQKSDKPPDGAGDLNPKPPDPDGDPNPKPPDHSRSPAGQGPAGAHRNSSQNPLGGDRLANSRAAIENQPASKPGPRQTTNRSRTDRQIGGDPNRQTDVNPQGQADDEPNRQTDLDSQRQTDDELDRQTDLHPQRQTDDEPNRQTDLDSKRQTDDELDRQTDLHPQRQSDD